VRTVRTVAELRAALAEASRPVGLVPTMGALHEGHLSLLRAARAESRTVVMSLFVNPAQFDQEADLAAYPRDERRDAELAREAGVDVLFAPPVEEVYPAGFSTRVEMRGPLAEELEGDPRERGPGHFAGVATVVTKLFNMVGPDVAYFGQKDAQQALVIRKLARDLDFPVRIAVLPTVRDPDGLALSSRNARLTPEQRERALGLSKALSAAERAVAAGARERDAVLDAARELAATFAANPPLVVQGVKDVLNAAREPQVADGLRYVAAWNSAFLPSRDLGEAVQAFFERRPPRFQGH
jgi:pantoate--beta-alanine ligase